VDLILQGSFQYRDSSNSGEIRAIFTMESSWMAWGTVRATWSLTPRQWLWRHNQRLEKRKSSYLSLMSILGHGLKTKSTGKGQFISIARRKMASKSRRKLKEHGKLTGSNSMKSWKWQSERSAQERW